ncbi:methyl-accepting chemotaxis protein [Beggiatoa alba B18LD]|uniref:Methyl-accepting chemotaxis protein n=1 Tax=Beggiatoa alba B18LD TaxID=395493 RepID=I3CF58_9GAMM|nr:methyl-accepting chemotaxis protein [Beggiatoa alba]EIJ42251.1 methyl-accepting chemotaxis protein [Beggiatoa alba B18LD]
MKHLSIGKKFLILAIFSIATIIGVGLYSLYNTATTFAWVDDVYNTAQDVQDIALDIGEPLNKVHQLSLLIVTIPQQKEQFNLNIEQQAIIKNLDEIIAKWQARDDIVKYQTSFNQFQQAWTQYKTLSSYTIQTLLEGYREAAFINASGAEQQQFDVLLFAFHQWMTEHIKNAKQIQVDATKTYQLTLIVIIISFSLFILLVSFFNFYTAQLIVKPINKAVAIANAIANGNLQNQITDITRDESGQLLQSLAQMQNQLREQIAEEKRIADEAMRINQALDSVTTQVLITDNNYKIIYMNKALKNFFQQEADNFRRELPQFDPAQLLNNSIDVLHKDASAHRELLARLQTTEKSKLDLEGLTIEYMLTPVINEQGERIGFVKEFNNRTQEVATEQEIKQVIHAASQGDFKQRIQLTQKVGFFKAVSENINHIMDLNQQVLQDTMRMFAALAKGDLTQAITHNYIGDFAQLKTDANTTVMKLTSVMELIQASAQTIDETAETLLQNNLSLNQRTESQAAALEETAASIEEMTSTIQQNANNAKQANDLAINARKDAQAGGEIVAATIQAMTNINQSSKRVADIIGVINDIAFQTNLLALNAAVEAARAGEQGRGFAVVAGEVRNLAQRSAEAAKEIRLLIQDSVNKINEGSILVNQSGEALQRIFTAVKKVSDIIADITDASQEQTLGIHQVNKAISQMDEMTQQNNTMVTQAMEANETMREQASQLTQQVAFFQLKNTTKVVPNLTSNTQKTVKQLPQSPSKVTLPVFKHENYKHLEKMQERQKSKTTQRQTQVTLKTHDDDWEDF